MKTLEDIRKSANLKQTEMAELLGVSSRTVQNIEKNSSNIKDNILQKYIQIFDISYDDIFLGTEYEKNVFDKKRKQRIFYKIKELEKA